MRLIIYILVSFPLTVFAQVVKPYKATQEVLERYPVDSPLLIKNAWLPNGEQIIKNGNGYRIYDVGEIRRYQYQNGDANGEVLFLDTTQTIIFTKGFSKNGMPDSVWTNFFPNKKTKAIFNYKNGKLNGSYLKYYENGQLESKALYRNGLIFSEYISYFSSGQIMMQGQYKDSVVCSPDSTFLNNNYFKPSPGSAKIGKWISYYENGKPKSIVYYSGNCIVSIEIINKNMSQLKKRDCAEGEGLYYSEKGDLEKRVIYSNCDNEH